MLSRISWGEALTYLLHKEEDLVVTDVIEGCADRGGYDVNYRQVKGISKMETIRTFEIELNSGTDSFPKS